MAIGQKLTVAQETRTTDDIVHDVLEMMAKISLPARPLPDWIIAAGVSNPFQLQEVRRALKPFLSENGTHFDLTQSGRWLRTTERWAEGLGVEKGRAEMAFRAVVPAVESVRSHVTQAAVPAAVKEAAGTALDVLNVRANKKLDKASIEIAAEQIQTLVGRTEELARDNARIEKYAEDTRQTKDKLLMILDRLSAKLGTEDGSGFKIAAE
jgi:hypothetical protein